jgi:HNH endonuclease
LIANKSAIGIVLQNLSKKQRIPKMRDMFEFLVSQTSTGRDMDPASVFRHLALRGKIIDLTLTELGSSFTDNTKSQIFYKDAITRAAVCPICGGRLDPAKSVSYDHIQRVSEGGLGTAENGQMVHPYCNTGMKG